ncbi:uncharacterized protein LOC141649155 [Silene latifolia]|uniref:uncharacterized protein LOC141649155 n=1 Tax=Silene latifolia TaxID=37657 RepID=UPI003D770351
MSDLDSTESWENFGENSIDYNPLFETTIDFETRDDAFNWAQKIAFENGFALVKANNGAKNRKKNGLLASYFRCKRHGLQKESDDLEKPRRSQKCSCKFRIRAIQNFVSKNDQETVVWNIVTSEGAGLHNHNVAVYKDGDRHFAGLDAEEKAYVRQQTLVGVLPRDIKNVLHLRTPKKPQPSSTQLYNETRKIRKEVRGERNTAQQMLALVVEAKYVHWHEIDSESKELTHIFMAHPEAIKLFRAYPYVVIMDSTYKTKIYKNPLIEMVGVTPTGSSFLIACSMIPTESDENYKWLLRKLAAILDVTGAASPSAWLKSKHLTLDSMWSRINDMLESQHSKIKKELEDEMSKPRRASCTFSLLQGNVSTKAIELMVKELTRGLGLGIGVDDRCRHVLRTTHGLPCACNLASLHKRGRRVHLEDIHVFWKTLVYDTPQQMPKNDGDLWEELVDGVRNSDPVKLRAAIDLLRDFHHPEDQEILPPSINEHPKRRPRGSTTRNKSGFEHAERNFGTPSTHGSTNADQSQQRLGDFESGPPGAPLGRNFTIGLISTWAKRWDIPEVLWGHFDGWVGVRDDGHCGFRVISHAQRGQETDYIVMRE